MFDTVRGLVNTGKWSDSFAKHWASHHFPDSHIEITLDMVRQMKEIDILWQGNPISCMKSFKKRAYCLCMTEHLLILKTSRGKDAKKLINSNNEIYGGCHHIPKFHRFTHENSSNKSTTDEVRSGQKELTCSAVAPHCSNLTLVRAIFPDEGERLPMFIAAVGYIKQDKQQIVYVMRHM